MRRLAAAVVAAAAAAAAAVVANGSSAKGATAATGHEQTVVRFRSGLVSPGHHVDTQLKIDRISWVVTDRTPNHRVQIAVTYIGVPFHRTPSHHVAFHHRITSSHSITHDAQGFG